MQLTIVLGVISLLIGIVIYITVDNDSSLRWGWIGVGPFSFFFLKMLYLVGKGIFKW